MKLPLLLFATTLAASAVQLPPGAISNNQSFAVHNGSQLVNTTLDDYQGKILVIMLMTPWCPTCISNGTAVGNGILDPFNAASRGALRGKNNQGIEIDSLLLSVEHESEWESDIISLADTNAYEKWGIDANAGRQNPREMLGYYRGGYPNGVNSSNLYDWGNDRRRVVVLNLVRSSPSHGYRQIVMNQNSFSSTASAATAAQGLINAIMPPPPPTTVAQWTAGYSFPSGTSGADHDPDRDGSVNLLEFFHGTHPLQAASRSPGPSLVREGTTLKLVYRRAKNIGGFTLEHRTSTTLGSWQVLTTAVPQTTADLGAMEEITVTLPASTNPARFYQLAVTLTP